MVSPERVRVWAARLAAPVAFFFAATVLVVLVQRGLEDVDSASGTDTSSVTTSPTETNEPDGTTGSAPPSGRRFYRVRPGDTLESIAARFQIDVDELLELNPGIDPLALNPGQRIRVRPRS
jgi:LysM repeat protein